MGDVKNSPFYVYKDCDTRVISPDPLEILCTLAALRRNGEQHPQPQDWDALKTTDYGYCFGPQADAWIELMPGFKLFFEHKTYQDLRHDLLNIRERKVGALYQVTRQGGIYIPAPAVRVTEVPGYWDEIDAYVLRGSIAPPAPCLGLQASKNMH